MRLVSCVGLLMVIPAVALLTLNNNIPVNQQRIIEPRHPETVRSTTLKQVKHTDSVLLSKIDDVHIAAQNHIGLTAHGDVKSIPIPTKQ